MFLKICILAALTIGLTGCQAPYLIQSAISQADLLRRREPLIKVLESHTLRDEEKAKLKIAQEAKIFAQTELGLKTTGNYESFVQLDSPYVTYVVSAAPKDRLEHHTWWFPIVGSVPYKGFFNPKDAQEQAAELRAEGLDTFVRGVSAYSTLGWFDDPIMSSMLRYSDYDLANTIIHETVHATLYIRSQADFNERLATFIGNVGAELFFQSREGAASQTIAKEKIEVEDERLFSAFISGEISSLETWYNEHKTANPKLDSKYDQDRLLRFHEIAERFARDIRPKLKSERLAQAWDKDLRSENLNNARILAWRLYVYDMSDFERAFSRLGRDPKKLVEFAKSLAKETDPESKLKEFANSTP